MRIDRITRKINPYGTIFILILLFCIVLYSDTSLAETTSEIDHLIQFIETSGCTFIRNGKNYGSQEASEHIRKKFAYTKRSIKTTEDFIKYVATESSMSGKPYQVVCDGINRLTAEWLAVELARFRRKAP
jgi:hypothetical protein